MWSPVENKIQLLITCTSVIFFYRLFLLLLLVIYFYFYFYFFCSSISTSLFNISLAVNKVDSMFVELSSEKSERVMEFQKKVMILMMIVN